MVYIKQHSTKGRWPLDKDQRIQELEQEVTRLQELARRDHLTGLFNRREFDERLSAQIRHETPFSVLMMDIDHFKEVNDTFGHAAGDAVLEGLARRLLGHVRTEDVPYRYGGEEFVLLAQVPRKDLKGVAKRLLQAMNGDYRAGNQSIPITVSIGGATWIPGKSVAALMRRADKALYRAKKKGRCRIELAS